MGWRIGPSEQVQTQVPCGASVFPLKKSDTWKSLWCPHSCCILGVTALPMLVDKWLWVPSVSPRTSSVLGFLLV